LKLQPPPREIRLQPANAISPKAINRERSMKRQTLIGAAVLGVMTAIAAAEYHAGAPTIVLESEIGAHGTITPEDTLARRWHLAQISGDDLCYALGYPVKPDEQC
jgi:hypothetical protein